MVAPLHRKQENGGREKILSIFDEVCADKGSVLNKDVLQYILQGVGLPEDVAIKLLARAGTAKTVDYRELIDGIFCKDVEQVAEDEFETTEPGLESSTPLLRYIRSCFAKQGASTEGISRDELKLALRAFQRTVPSLTDQYWVVEVVSRIFEELDVSAVGRISWPDFEQWLLRWESSRSDDEIIADLFDIFESHGNGKLHAQDLMDALLRLSRHLGDQEKAAAISASEAGQIIRDLDPDEDGDISFEQFSELMHAARSSLNMRSDGGSPHLVLNFDVNNTIVMIDSATGADTENLLSMVICNSAWGKIDFDEAGLPVRWVLQHKELSATRPEEDLRTYTEFAELTHPFVDGSDFPDKAAERIANEAVKESRRAALWTFTEDGMPGESLRPKLVEMKQALVLPEGVSGSEKAIAAGLTGGTVQLLPSFLHLLRELKRAGRSFSLCFRTFGRDLPKLQQEMQALCENRHPYYPESDEVVLDGSDGKCDYRMCLSSLQGCGTFYRNPHENDFIALIMGTIEQPKTLEEGIAFYANQEVEIATGVQDVCDLLSQLLSQSRTLCLRDFYQGWAAVGSKSHGGKPLFLGRIDPDKHSIFFDDHISASDPKIVDPIDVHLFPRRFSCAQIYGVHLVQAQPVHSITNRNYFLECIEACEKARAAKLQRWQKLQRLLGDYASVQQVLSSIAGSASPKSGSCSSSISSRSSPTSKAGHLAFRPWMASRAVRNSQVVSTFALDS
eukprot:TRINITY_DN94129_c0_g1_i1.p1 TRINITY_DN94129_c0_g1~~TRINITY_DN94129_c0_g1_i1.p1  ORF type:complete len:733 (-),score=150.97 TRINITY_DN94129_c0_g1_i1:16-2214(-)